jgi:hypothetical protein
MAWLTRSTVSLRTPLRSFKTLSTVARLTPAALAKSFVVGRMQNPDCQRKTCPLFFSF